MKKYLKISFWLFFGLIILYFLFQFTSFESLKLVIKEINISLLLIGFVLFVISLVLRSFRFKYFFKNMNLSKLNYINALSLFLINMLPFRSGELSYFYLFKKEDIKYTESLSVMYIIRLSDVLSIFIILIMSFLLLASNNQIIKNATLLFSILIFILVFLTFLFMYKTNYFIFMKKIIKFLFSDKIYKKIIFHLKEFSNSFKKNGLKKLIISTLFAIPILFLRMLVSYLFFCILIDQANFFLILLGLSFIQLFSIFPINVVGNIGTFEAYFTLIFGTLKFSISDLVNYSLILHIVIIIYSLFNLILFYIIRFLSKKLCK